MEKNYIVVQDVEAHAGEKAQGWFRVLETDVLLPMTLICGKEAGKTLLLLAGIHGSEYNGIQTLIQLAKEINPAALHGNIIMIHMANPSGFRKIVQWVVPEDNQNLNRMFPGRPEGSLSEKIASAITLNLFSVADYLVDLHSGDLHEELEPFVFFPGKAEEHIVADSVWLAQHFDVPYRVKSGSIAAAYSWAAQMGIPTVLLERGGLGLWSQQEVEANLRDLYNILACLHMLPDKEPLIYGCQKEFSVMHYPFARQEGLWEPAVAVGQQLKKGQVFGLVKNCFGEVLDTLYCEDDGRLLYLTRTLSIRKNDPLGAYGRE